MDSNHAPESIDTYGYRGDRCGTSSDVGDGGPGRQSGDCTRGTVEATLRDRITRAMHQGRLQPGTRLPSARNMAEDLGVDRRCVLAALRALAADGLVELRARSGVFAARPPRVSGAPKSSVDARAEGALLDFLARGVAAGWGVSDLVEALSARLRRAPLRTACVSDNADQGAALCAEARRTYGLSTSWVDAHTIADDRALPQAARSAQLVLTSAYHAAAAHRVANRVGAPVTMVTPRADLSATLLDAVAREPVYFVGTDPRFAQAMARHFADAPPEHCRPIILGRDDVRGVPRHAAVYLMPSAEARLGGVPPSWRLLPRTCAFSAESARQVVSAILRVAGPQTQREDRAADRHHSL